MVDVAEENTDLLREELEKLLNPKKLIKGDIKTLQSIKIIRVLSM